MKINKQIQKGIREDMKKLGIPTYRWSDHEKDLSKSIAWLSIALTVMTLWALSMAVYTTYLLIKF